VFIRVLLLHATALCSVVVAEDDVGARARAALQNLAREWDVPAAVLTIVAPAEDLCVGSYGKGRGGVAIDADTLFGIASVTKGLASTLVASCVADGAMRWDAAIVRYNPRFALHDAALTRRLTILDCLCHRSGIEDHDFLWYADSRLDRHALVGQLSLLRPVAEYGTFSYNNLLYLAIADAVEGATGRPWDEELRSRILIPLSMTRTFTASDAARHEQNSTDPHERLEGQTRRVAWRRIDSMAPALGVWSCSRDLGSWARWLLGGKTSIVGSPDAKALAAGHVGVAGTVVGSEYGLGCYRLNHGSGTIITYLGQAVGWSGVVMVSPKLGRGVIVLANVGDNDFCLAVAYHVLWLLCGDVTFGDIASRLLADYRRRSKLEGVVGELCREVRGKGVDGSGRYVGRYAHDGLADINVFREGEQLLLSTGELRGRLFPWSGGRFIMEWEQDYLPQAIVRFIVVGDRRVDALELTIVGWPEMSFKRM
jgi:CubicO group peptidase (beta-lactamase class C family)